MVKNNAKVFASCELFAGFDTTGTNNNVIKIGPLEFAKPSDKTINNNVYCSFQGVFLNQVLETDLDEVTNAKCFAYITDNTGRSYIKLAVAKDSIDNVGTAIKFITGLLIDYKIAQVAPAGTCRDALYEVSTYLADGTLVSDTIACPMPDVVRKILALEANHDINETGYYKHIVRLALVPKG